MATFGMEIPEQHVRILPAGTSKEKALELLVDALAQGTVIKDAAAFRAGLMAREAQGSTALSSGVAIPHLRHESVVSPAIAVGLSAEGIAFGAEDGQPTHLLVLFAIPLGQDKLYLNLLAQVMLALRNKTLFEQFLVCKSPSEAASLLNR